MKKGIVLSPYREQRRLRFSELILESGIKLYVVGAVEKQIQLNVLVTCPLALAIV